MALVIVNTVNSNPIVPRKEYLADGRVRYMLITGQTASERLVYLLLPTSVKKLKKGVVINSLEVVRFKHSKHSKRYRISWVQPWRRAQVGHVDLLLYMERDDVEFMFSRKEGVGFAHLGYHASDSEMMTFGLRIDPGTIVKVTSLTGGENFYFAVDRDEEGKLIFSRPTAEEVEATGIKWCRDLPIFRRAKR